MWSVHHQPADHWRALQLPAILQQLPVTSDLVTCQECIEHVFHPAQCSQLNQSDGRCVALLAGHKGKSKWFFSVIVDRCSPCSPHGSSTRMEAVERFFLVMVFIVLYKEVLISESADEMRDHSNESHGAEPSYGAVYYPV